MSFKGVGLIVGVGVESYRVRVITFCVIWQRKETNAWTKGRGTILLCVCELKEECAWTEGTFWGHRIGWGESREGKGNKEMKIDARSNVLADLQ